MTSTQPHIFLPVETRREAQPTARMKAPPMAAAADGAVTLVHIFPQGPSLGRRYALAELPATIGRDLDCAVSCDTPTVSRRHAAVERMADGHCRVVDLGSTNGTFVNDERVAVADLEDGAYLRVGDAIFRFLAAGNREAEYHHEVHRLSVLDPLTEAHNRRGLFEFLELGLAGAARQGKPLALLLFDVDFFKGINDRFGHAAGDGVLRALAAVARDVVPTDALLARYGGEEFAVVLPGTGGEGALKWAEALRTAVEWHPFECGGDPFRVTVSVGVAVLPAGGRASPDELLGRADVHLYEAKIAGRNRVRSDLPHFDAPDVDPRALVDDRTPCRARSRPA